MIDAQTIANAFNQQNDLKSWKVTCTGELVHFSTINGIVAVIYEADTGRFAIKFNKFQAAFGDYMKAIARSMFVILNTLKSAGLPFEAPPSLDDIEVACSIKNGTIYARWAGEYLFHGMPEHVAIGAPIFLPPIHLNADDLPDVL